MPPASTNATNSVVRLASGIATSKFYTETNPEAERLFVELLERNSKATSNLLLNKPEDLFFDSKARLQGKYTLSHTALGQLCSKLLPGLSIALNNVSGAMLSDEELLASDEHDTTLALKWLNDAIQLRFKRLKAYSLIVDRDLQRVEGFVGRKYAFMPNLELYNRAKKFVEPLGTLVFSEGVLNGRRMLFRFKSLKPLFFLKRSDTLSEAIHGGLHFSNSETGDCSIRSSAVLLRRCDGSKAIGDFVDGSKLTHIKGKQFDKKFSELMDKAKDKMLLTSKFAPNFNALMSKPLGLGSTEEQHLRRYRVIELQLARQGLPSEFCQSVIKQAMYYGSSNVEQIDKSKNPYLVYSTRTAFDLYCALTRRARTLAIDDQEIAEQVAYKLLTGKLVV